MKRVSIQYTGPVPNLERELPFINDRPMPVCFVGGNGSGKSTVVSTIVNGMVVTKAGVFDDAEIEKGKVYRLRSRQFIHQGQNYYHTLVQFTDGIEIEEWVLDRSREKFEAELGHCPAFESWNQIPLSEDSHYRQIPIPDNTAANISVVKKAFSDGCVLYFPPNRFEKPAWLNETNLSGNATFEQRQNIKGLSERLIFCQRRVAATCDWLLNVLLDKLTTEVQNVPVNIQEPPTPAEIVMMRQDVDGPNSQIIKAIIDILKLIFADEQSQVQLVIGNKHHRQIGISITFGNGKKKTIQNIFSLSSGESSLFALFATILFDFDRSGATFSTIQNVAGIVVIDEIDTHLHLDLQRKVLPKLLRMFERVQFLITTHSPLFLLGLQDAFAPNSAQIISMPNGQPIAVEEFSEFDSAYAAFQETIRYRESVQSAVLHSHRPLLVVEGRSDKKILRVAWQKLYGTGSEPPFDIQTAGIEADQDKRDGGAEQLRRNIEFLATTSERAIIGLFDNDQKGNAQFKGLKKEAFEDWSITASYRKHRTASVWGILLPIVPGREEFVTESNINHRYLSIEHYFRNHILSSNGLKGDGILGTDVFEVCGNKMAFAENCESLDDDEFDDFRTLFATLQTVCNAFAIPIVDPISEG
ncbi:ATP-binding protein [Leptolyngbya sp. Heron Island J]|uniref:ATP-binding protein n=1 Tax=Leptolyngbya sp. Heron Island J TaxID=1385935 RepID=UPI001268D6E5|nr:ATP-binding protein [Leptolyngbya sp. Heron Island J]